MIGATWRRGVLTALAAAALGATACQVVTDTPPQPAPPGAAADAGSTGDASGDGGTASSGDAASADDGGGDDAATLADVLVPNAGPAVAVAAGSEHTCALTKAGAVLCWGSNTNGQLGDGTQSDSAVPVPVTGLAAGVTAIAAGDDHTCAIVSGDGGASAVCWGRNDHGQLGDGSMTDRAVPVAVTGLKGSPVVIAGGGLHTCALTSAGMRCWGDDTEGQLGDGAIADRATPSSVTMLPPVCSSVTAGGAHSCALSSSGAVLCWGFNASGQLGNGATTNSDVAVPVTNLSGGVTAIAGGNAHTCALAGGGAVECWGYGQFGQLGDSATADSEVPVAVSMFSSGARAIAAGGEHACAIDAHGGAWCWGEDQSGQLGDNASTDSAVPVAVASLASGATALAAGTAHTCALLTTGGIACWGWNVHGQLGNGTEQDSGAPIEVAGF